MQISASLLCSGKEPDGDQWPPCCSGHRPAVVHGVVQELMETIATIKRADAIWIQPDTPVWLDHRAQSPIAAQFIPKVASENDTAEYP